MTAREIELDPEKLKPFLEALTDLCDRHGFEIDGCGCCGSPWVQTQTKGGPFVCEIDGAFLQRGEAKCLH